MIRRLGPDGKPMITGLQDNSTLLTLQEIKELAARVWLARLSYILYS